MKLVRDSSHEKSGRFLDVREGRPSCLYADASEGAPAALRQGSETLARPRSVDAGGVRFPLRAIGVGWRGITTFGVQTRMAGKLEGKTAIITGAGRGIGRE